MQCLAPWGRASVHCTMRSIPRATRFIHLICLPSPVACHPARWMILIAFHVVFGKTVPDISLNAVANLGYAEARWLRPVYPGDTLRSLSTVIGLKQNSSGKTGVVWVRSEGFNQRGETVMSFVRWVMVRKNNLAMPAPQTVVPESALCGPCGGTYGTN